MLPSEREDYLEKILSLRRSLQRAPSIDEIAINLKEDSGKVAEEIKELMDTGDLISLPSGTVDLTSAGAETAERVIRKHCLLQCFLTEILGVEPEKASDEACVLEHSISDETIDRLGSYLEGPVTARCIRSGPVDPITRGVRRITDFNEGDELCVVDIAGGRGKVKRLMDLGIIPGEKIRLLRKLGSNAVVVLVKGCDIALGATVAASILVEIQK
jgi:DtxR family Mn-dependent transcriptional regulator